MEKVAVPSKGTYKVALKAFTIVNILFLIGGPCIIYPVMRLNNPTGKVEKVIRKYTEYTEVPAYLMLFSAGLMTLNGFLGIFSAYFDIPILFDSHEGFMFISLGLNLIATVTVSIIPPRPPKDNYENLFKAEAYHLLQHQKFKSIRKDSHMWDQIQESISCCGVLGPRDWLFSPLQAIPTSCCKNSKSKTQCLDLVGLEHNLSSVPFKQVRETIFPFLWRENCVDALQELTAWRKLDWTVFPLCLLLLESFLMAYSSLLLDFIREYTDYVSKRQLARPPVPSAMLEQRKREQIELRIIKSKLSLDVNLEETREIRKFSEW